MRARSLGSRSIALVLPALLVVVIASVVGASSAVSAFLGHGHAAHQGLGPTPVSRSVPRPAPKLASSSGKVQVRAAAPSALAVAAAGDQVALRQLIVATAPDDFGLPTWKAILDRAGTPYDVVFARTDQFDASRLVRPDGVGKYNAVLLTNHALLYQDANGDYLSAFDDAKWNTLWDYERAFKVRQVSLYSAYETFPEDYCLRAGSEGTVETPPVQASLTATGSQVFDTLKPSARIPITQSYLYRSVVAPGCGATPILTLGSDVLGVLSTSPDGRERAALTFSSNENLAQTDLLGYGLLRWATKGVFLGEQRHWINVDIDDWFNTTDHLYPDGHVESDPGFRLSGPEVTAINQQQNALRQGHPLAAGFKLNLPYNGDIDPQAPSSCNPVNSPDPLTSYSRCLKGNFRWINHTLTHPELNFTTYAQNRAEIQNNLTLGRRIGLTVPTEVLKTPEYSGLGVYNPDPNAPDDVPPTDFGLAGSNRELLRAASDLGVKYLHGNMSFASHRPSCFNCGIYHPLQPNLFIVPDWPTNIGYQTTTPAEQTLLFNNFYGPQGRFPFFDHNLSYPELLDYEAEVALQHVMSGSAYAHTHHQGNLHQYGTGKSLTFDWLNALLTKYTAQYKVPLKNPDWVALAKYVQDRNAHFGNFSGAQDAVWNRVANTVGYTPATTGSLFVTGATGAGSQTEKYGLDNISRVGLTARQTVTLTATPRP